MRKVLVLLLAAGMLLLMFPSVSAEDMEAENFYRDNPDLPLFVDAVNFSEGYAWIFFTEEDEYGLDQQHASVVDRSGRIVFTPDGPVSYASEFHDGTSFYTAGETDPWNQETNKTDVLIDSSGNELYRTYGDEHSSVKWERICGYANGYYLLIRFISGMTDANAEVALLNPDGTMAVDYTHDFKWVSEVYGDRSSAPLVGFFCSHDAGYAGLGWYWIGELVFSFDRHQVGSLSKGSVVTDFNTADRLVTNRDQSYNSDMEYIGVHHFTDYRIHPTRREFATDGMFWGPDKCYYDFNSNVVLSLADHYPDNYFECTPFYGGEYALMVIEGKDTNTYVTMINRAGDELFEPVMVKDYTPFVMDGYAIVALDRGGQDPEYVIMDSKGKVCHSVSEDFNRMKLDIRILSYNEGSLLIGYQPHSSWYYRFYPVKWAAEMGSRKYDLGVLE